MFFLIVILLFTGFTFFSDHLFFDEFPQDVKRRFYNYWVPNVFYYYFPTSDLKKEKDNNLSKLKKYDNESILSRVNYYNKMSENVSLDSVTTKVGSFNQNLECFGSFYFFDTYQYIKYFDLSYKVAFAFGDVTHIPDVPSLVKSRPIDGNNQNSILMNLNKLRHFRFVKDGKKFEDKKNILVWRGSVHQTHRIKFMHYAFNDPLCDVGQTNDSKEHPEWKKSGMSIREQLEYKFLFSIEGNDVATSTKWMMSSNSLVFMQTPKYETWFMEGRLIPNYHYVLIKDDLSGQLKD